MATNGLRQTLGSPELVLAAAFTGEDIAGDPYEYPAEEHVRWDVGMGCMVQVEHEADEDQPLRLRVAVGPDFPIATGRELRAITPDQLRSFACKLIALAEHADRAGGVS
jgi:hypothetical protein